jgi:hypothetical protein
MCENEIQRIEDYVVDVKKIVYGRRG